MAAGPSGVAAARSGFTDVQPRWGALCPLLQSASGEGALSPWLPAKEAGSAETHHEELPTRTLKQRSTGRSVCATEESGEVCFSAHMHILFHIASLASAFRQIWLISKSSLYLQLIRTRFCSLCHSSITPKNRHKKNVRVSLQRSEAAGSLSDLAFLGEEHIA